MHGVDLGRIDPELLAVAVLAVEGRRDDHPLRQQIGKGFVQRLLAEQADVTHQLGPETRVEQVQDGVLDAADVLVDAALAPVGDALVDHRPGVVRTAIAQEIPG
jgi:hypothetical protein